MLWQHFMSKKAHAQEMDFIPKEVQHNDDEIVYSLGKHNLSILSDFSFIRKSASDCVTHPLRKQECNKPSAPSFYWMIINQLGPGMASRKHVSRLSTVTSNAPNFSLSVNFCKWFDNKTGLSFTPEQRNATQRTKNECTHSALFHGALVKDVLLFNSLFECDLISVFL